MLEHHSSSTSMYGSQCKQYIYQTFFAYQQFCYRSEHSLKNWPEKGRPELRFRYEFMLQKCLGRDLVLDAISLHTGRPEQGRPEQGRPEKGRPEKGRPEKGRPELRFRCDFMLQKCLGRDCVSDAISLHRQA